MPPRWAVHTLGLCNVIAGALVVLAPSLLMPGLDGNDTTTARLLSASLGMLVAAVGAGAWLMPAAAVRAYLWLFGVGVKLLTSVLWGCFASHSGVGMLWAGAMSDLAVALVIASGLVGREP